MRTAAIIGVGIVCFLAGIGVGAGVAWMIAGRNTVGLSDVERTLIEQTAYAEGWNDGYEARRTELREIDADSAPAISDQNDDELDDTAD